MADSSSNDGNGNGIVAVEELSLDQADWAALRAQFERDGYLVFEGK